MATLAVGVSLPTLPSATARRLAGRDEKDRQPLTTRVCGMVLTSMVLIDPTSVTSGEHGISIGWGMRHWRLIGIARLSLLAVSASPGDP